MTTAPETDATDDKKEELETEKTELEQDIKETEEEAEKARESGDTERAEKLEAQIKKVVSGELAEIKAALKALTDRPFHPAPEADKDTSTTPAAEADKDKDQDQGDDKPEERVHRFGSRRWFGDRAYED